MVLISAHRSGTGSQGAATVSAADVRRALHGPGEYVEVDVRVTRDGVLVLSHDEHVTAGRDRYAIGEHTLAELQQVQHRLSTYTEALHEMAATGKGIHVDLKLPGSQPALAVQAAEAAVAVLPGGRVLITSDQDAHLADLARWRSRSGAGLRLALTVGGRRPGHQGLRSLWHQVAQFFPGRRWRRSGADVLAVHWVAALVRVGRWAARHRVPLVVWTVDRPALLRHFLRPGRAWVVVTNRPELAARIRGPEPAC